MSYRIEKLLNESIIIVTLNEDFADSGEGTEVAGQPAQLREEWNALLAQGNMVSLIDSSRYLHRSIDEQLRIFNAFLLGERKLKGLGPIVLYTSTFFDKLAAKGVNSATFGYVQVLLADSYEEALAKARELAAAH